MAGKSPYLQPVQFQSDSHRIGEIVTVRITRAGSNSLFGEWIGSGSQAAA
jgi:tRNA-2-methylthio-N6-dimethylallyladenosine synthase